MAWLRSGLRSKVICKGKEMIKEVFAKVMFRLMLHPNMTYNVYVNSVEPIVRWMIRRRVGRAGHARVVFVLSELAAWKTERLYLDMLADERFEPVIGIEKSLEVEGEHEEVIRHCEAHGYDYVVLDTTRRISEILHPDVIIYQKPYWEFYVPLHRFESNLDCLFVYINYTCHSIIEDWTVHQPLRLFSQQLYFENEMTASDFRQMMYNHGRNIRVTGLPVMDELIRTKADFADPWRNDGKGRKRIIWAPHHTIGQTLPGVKYSTFLEYSDFMLQLAEKYRDEVQWAFKPHPRLILELSKMWGKERAEAYYAKWDAMENTQLETGKYDGLFHHSDAMIHDCSSFTMEYHYTHNPVMYLMRSDNHDANMNEFSKKAFRLHYMGRSAEDIERFVRDVIAGVDPMRTERDAFYRECLLPPGGRTATANIKESMCEMLGLPQK